MLGSPTLAVDDRLNDRRYVAAGTRAYVVGTQAGRFPAMGWHTRGEMGGVWSPPLKLLDGVWFGVDGEWFGPATRFESGYGYVSMDLPAPEGRDLSVRRIDFAPDGRRAAAFGLEFTAGDADPDSVTLDGKSVEYETRRTHRGTAVVASVEEVGDEHELAITTVGGE